VHQYACTWEDSVVILCTVFTGAILGDAAIS